jgi:hypothetical protein
VRLHTLLSFRWLCVAWALASTLVLAVAAYADPYLLALAAFVAASCSGLLVLGAAGWSRRNLGWALAATLPTAGAFLLLSTYRWA